MSLPANGAAAQQGASWEVEHAAQVAAVRKKINDYYDESAKSGISAEGYRREDLDAVNALVDLYNRKRLVPLGQQESFAKDIRTAQQALLSGRGEYIKEDGTLSFERP